MKIGLIDSGTGGLAFLKGIIDDNDYILIMDKAYFPYGNKSKEFLILRTLYLCKYLILKDVDYIILACNTLSIIALPFVKLIYNNVYGVFDLFNIKSNSIFLGSKNSSLYISKIYKDIIVIDAQEMINKIECKKNINDELNFLLSLSSKYDEIYLGCTHFIRIKHLLNEKFISQDILYKRVRKKLVKK